MINYVVIAVCAVICGCDDFVSIAEFGRTKRGLLERFLDLSAGIPSHDRFNVIFAMIKPSEFEKCLVSWITALHDITKGQVIAIDGKTTIAEKAARYERISASGKTQIVERVPAHELLGMVARSEAARISMVERIPMADRAAIVAAKPEGIRAGYLDKTAMAFKVATFERVSIAQKVAVFERTPLSEKTVIFSRLAPQEKSFLVHSLPAAERTALGERMSRAE